MSEHEIHDAINAKHQNAELIELESRVVAIEAECRRLRLALGARTTGHPIELGHTFYPPGDPIPSRGGPNEHLVGFIYTHQLGKDFVVTRFEKNDSQRTLQPGESMSGGKVDKRLSHAVQPNDYFYLEL